MPATGLPARETLPKMKIGELSIHSLYYREGTENPWLKLNNINQIPMSRDGRTGDGTVTDLDPDEVVSVIKNGEAARAKTPVLPRPAAARNETASDHKHAETTMTEASEPPLIRKYGRPIPPYVLKGEKGVFTNRIGELSFETFPIYIRIEGGWWAKISETEHRPVKFSRQDWYATQVEPTAFSPTEVVKVILL